MGRVEDKVAFITGAARGQGRAHAMRLAEEGAAIVAVDICDSLPTVPMPGATPEDLAETVRLVEDRDQRIVAIEADVRDLSALEAAAQTAVTEFGGIDIVVANAGIASLAPALEMTEDMFTEMIDINLTGVWKTVKATAPSMVARGEGGSIILISSIAGLIAFPGLAHYVSAKHGVTGLMRTLAVELAPHNIRVNSIHPGQVDTTMIDNPVARGLFTGDPETTKEASKPAFQALNALPIPWMEAVDIANAVLYLGSDEARYVTGATQVIDAGCVAPHKIPHG